MKRLLGFCILALLASCSRPITSGTVIRKGIDYQGHYIDIEQWSGRGLDTLRNRLYIPKARTDSLRVGEWYDHARHREG
ncbi:MAG: hypothetical protein ACE5EO_08750 [Candidatus Krumholzibacteriia bacterium]